MQQALQLVLAFTASLRASGSEALRLSASPRPQPTAQIRSLDAVQRGILAALLAFAEPPAQQGQPADALEHALNAARDAIDYDDRQDHRHGWVLISLITAVVRGVVTDNLVTDARGFRSVDDEDFGEWIIRHGGHPDVLESPLVRGVYDLVFGYEDADPNRPACAAGLTIFLIGMVLFGYRGAIFWKMTAGMGDVVMAPLYQALRRRGVQFEFFHRLDALHLDEHHQRIEHITLGRQAELAVGVSRYEPLIHVRGLPVFPDHPRSDQIVARAGLPETESHFGQRNDVETRCLRRGVDFDHVVLAVSIGIIPVVAAELISDRPEWRDMTHNVRTVATQAFQIWLRPDEPALGWNHPGTTVSAYLRPFETWASMPQTLWAEDWPPEEEPRTVAYFCGSLNAEWPTSEPNAVYVRRHGEQVRAAAADHVNDNLGLFFPNAFGNSGFDWRLLSGVTDEKGAAAIATQHVSVNIDPSDRYVQSLPGSDAYRLRPDESGYDNLVLAGDWTDCGLNAGCIEAAVLSGLQAANVLLGHGRFHRIRGYYLP